MPKFVPVVDTEKPRSEQVGNDPSFSAHRRFDDPFSVHSDSKTDRGWKQGDVGWGVVRTFGDDKDDGAQVMKHAEGANKMVRNEKGLWVKAKTVVDDPLVVGSSSVAVGRGRGKAGVSVLDKFIHDSFGDDGDKHSSVDVDTHHKDDSRYQDHANDEDIASHRVQHRDRMSKERDLHYREDREKSRKYDETDRGRTRSREKESKKRLSPSADRHRNDSRPRRSKKRSPSRSRSRSRGTSRDDKRGRKGRISRSRSRSESSHRHRKSYRRSSSRSESRRRFKKDSKRDRHSRDRRDKRRARDDSRDRGDSRSRRRDRSQSSTPDDRYRSRTSRYRERDRDSDRKKRRSPSLSSRSPSRSPPTKHRRSSAKPSRKSPSQSPQRVERTPQQEQDSNKSSEPSEFKITAIQVVNHFQETFANSKMSSEKRLREILEVFYEDSKIVSLKTLKVYLDGKEKIETSFRQTKPSEVTVSKRIYLEPNIQDNNDVRTTFCFDFHRQKLAPGLGDPDKENLLLYQCKGPKIVQIWGMVDVDRFADNSSLKESDVYASNPWQLVKAIVSKSWDVEEAVVQECAHFHDYDHMEVWG